ncbi:bifunctional UDP-N-acetylmuramoyl-tripeptide:D-alanyl-D-alanine ligase/alanine racemase [Algoriphagus zhangzhouensis]|uniref:Alanine racemase n=1 Tax=Algoriphagus zhangzhouensis TaxID=1073327 RepID=A0A1M7ZA94_9BACT|nr:bifunctional UDP-N-acetylmuramoyl-tripeptide:D-alanyl-D-alanine ligase/alanine racemase [Algoriphagus zhangzhouensis]TDY47272.1 UDP-N-acetylmuramoyl-tripeptide--D-alanyl-D-alanine ligase [Algoriphagus zhangzhouensis]SHO61732.1 UDP-N-acetylmuramoyl-tripeptide--D-alanyl-D-alanine ligase [Algoriphagus zhangzhouensis]
MVQALTALQIAHIVEGKLQGDHPGLISRVSIDSRQILQPEATIFVALRGAKADGATFIPQLLKEGIACFLIHEDQPIVDGAAFIKVPDTKIALQKLAAFQRKQFEKPVIGITGSNGKTIVKEWLGQLLSQQYSVAKSPKSYNSQVGVPLSVFEIQSYHQVAILEVGVSKKGEMAALETIAKPNLGIFTNIGSAHDSGFSSTLEKIEEKAQLFRNSDLIIYCKDLKEVAQVLERQFPDEKLISWSDQAGADFTRSIKTQNGVSKIFLMKSDLSTYTFQTGLSDNASLENLTNTIIASLTLGVDAHKIQEGISNLRQVDMRLTLKPGINESLLIDDTYNNDLAGLRVALDFMRQQRPKNRKILILSDFKQQGQPKKIYPEVSRLINSHEIDLVIAVGEEIQAIEEIIDADFSTFKSTSELNQSLKAEDFASDLILITGAREYGFEKVVNHLQQRIHGTTLEINLNALTHNFNFYKRKLKTDTKVMVMVKAFAYGGGATEIANHIQQMGADYLAVAYTDEGVALRKQGIRLPIMVLNPMAESFQLCKTFDLEPVVFSLEFFEQLAQWTSSESHSMKIHLDLDTGMHRLGFEKVHLLDLIPLIKRNPQLEIASIYTHLVGADEEIHSSFSIQQLALFSEMSQAILQNLSYKPILHALNSAGIVAFPEHQLDMVRLGIGLYGVEVTGKYTSELQSISTLKTTISQIKSLEEGETVGYSRKGVMAKPGKIGTLAIGYADGYDRRFSNGKGFVLIHGQKAPVIGNVCMDMVMVDISDIDAKPGDEAIIYGPEISLKELADQIGTIPYELLTNISTRVKRVYYLD